MSEPKPVAFGRFGGLRLDQAIDEVGPEAAIFLRDVDWDGSIGRVRPRDGFQKLKATDATGPYKGLFAHSATRLLATKRVSESSLKLVAIDREGTEKKEASLNKAIARSIFAHFGTPAAAYTYMRTLTAEQKVVRFDGENFTEPTATLNKNPDGTGGTAGQLMPKGACMIAWPAGDNRLVVANTAAKGGPGEAASSNSHVWFSDPGDAESWHTDPATQAGEANYVQLSPGDGEEITEVAIFGGLLLVFKETKLFVFYGVSEDGEGRPEFDFREVALGEGSRMKRPFLSALAETSDRLATSVADGVYFCTSDGVWATSGGEPAKISQALRPLEEVSPFDGPMADFLDGELESFRWPATGVVSLGRRIFVRRYEFTFVYDIPTAAWTCWRAPAVSMTVWTGLTGGGAESSEKLPGTTEEVEKFPEEVSWVELANVKAKDEKPAFVELPKGGFESKLAKLTNLGFAIPEGATIVGIMVTRKLKTSSSVFSGTKLYKAGSLVGTEKSGTTVTATEWKELAIGGAEDLWGTTWTPAQVNASGFGVAIQYESALSSAAKVELDWVTISVFYLSAEMVQGVRPRLLCTQSKSILFTSPTAKEEAGTRQAEWQSGFYDLGSEDEKTLEGMRVWGQGEVSVASYMDLGAAADFEDNLDLGEVGLGQDRSYSTQTGFLFSHRLRLATGSSAQRLVRYLRETELAGGEGAP